VADLSAFPVTPPLARRAPGPHPALFAAHAERREGLDHARGDGLPYEPHLVRFDAKEQMTPEFLSISPNNKIPAILDPNGPGGKPLPLFESGAILIYLADKSGQLLPADPAGRYTAIQWLMFQMGGIGPMFGQVGFFHKFAGKDYEDKRPRDRYIAERERCSRWSTGASARAPGSPATTTRSPTSPPSRGSRT
jgi:GST-like protein